MTRRRLLIAGALFLSALLTSGCDQSVPEEVVGDKKKKGDEDYNYHKRYPWGQGSDPMPSSESYHGSGSSAPRTHHH